MEIHNSTQGNLENQRSCISEVTPSVLQLYRCRDYRKVLIPDYSIQPRNILFRGLRPRFCRLFSDEARVYFSLFALLDPALNNPSLGEKLPRIARMENKSRSSFFNINLKLHLGISLSKSNTEYNRFGNLTNYSQSDESELSNHHGSERSKVSSQFHNYFGRTLEALELNPATRVNASDNISAAKSTSATVPSQFRKYKFQENSFCSYPEKNTKSSSDVQQNGEAAATAVTLRTVRGEVFHKYFGRTLEALEIAPAARVKASNNIPATKSASASKTTNASETVSQIRQIKYLLSEESFTPSHQARVALTAMQDLLSERQSLAETRHTVEKVQKNLVKELRQELHDMQKTNSKDAKALLQAVQTLTDIMGHSVVQNPTGHETAPARPLNFLGPL